MKINCRCGSLIIDQTDYHSNKGYIISDQDYFDLLEIIDNAIEKSGPTPKDKERAVMGIRSLIGGFQKNVYQCFSCGRIYISTKGNELKEFTAVEHSQGSSILSSTKGESWKRPIIGDWDDSRKGEILGYLWCYGYSKEYSNSENFQTLQEDYFKLLGDLSAKGTVRSALLKHNKQVIHSWVPN
ncbi:hypothetical protein [Paenibacillus aceris]|uniref:Uncharacterized protein n=1 Tax=Paenibacillus aceris TaxID=869555 RepID=A0ABS4I9H5_9BACL|nr:hypothetical protein [Paenibacillus aceris]MBP1967558.1 hypothetical protein [Paenibacillus aceris]NHW37550.1 hypothetical protein [Paenibacillus aceris]